MGLSISTHMPLVLPAPQLIAQWRVPDAAAFVLFPSSAGCLSLLPGWRLGSGSVSAVPTMERATATQRPKLHLTRPKKALAPPASSRFKHTVCYSPVTVQRGWMTLPGCGEVAGVGGEAGRGGRGRSWQIKHVPAFPPVLQLYPHSSHTAFLGTVVLSSLWNILNNGANGCVFMLSCSQFVNAQPCVCFPPCPDSLIFFPSLCSEIATPDKKQVCFALLVF